VSANTEQKDRELGMEWSAIIEGTENEAVNERKLKEPPSQAHSPDNLFPSMPMQKQPETDLSCMRLSECIPRESGNISSQSSALWRSANLFTIGQDARYPVDLTPTPKEQKGSCK
jgi:hypothetical protein